MATTEPWALSAIEETAPSPILRSGTHTLPPPMGSHMWTFQSPQTEPPQQLFGGHGKPTGSAPSSATESNGDCQLKHEHRAAWDAVLHGDPALQGRPN